MEEEEALPELEDPLTEIQFLEEVICPLDLYSLLCLDKIISFFIIQFYYFFCLFKILKGFMISDCYCVVSKKKKKKQQGNMRPTNVI